MNLNRRIDHDARYHQTMVPNLFTLILLLSAAVGGVALARRLKLPPVLSYLLIGIAIGPHGLAMLHESEEVHAEVVVAGLRPLKSEKVFATILPDS